MMTTGLLIFLGVLIFVAGVGVGVRLERKDQELWQERDLTTHHWRRRA